ncbi:hypothetical protein V757_03090 [Pelistega indica]|uniref:Cthe-2314-like HEPN domain-containing protein n=1 Tax=Pelistega indica TaxID=1414851 RepID=V8G8C0_9BURK|nr:hypothetical protein [Pelistega indica]ETD72650.1 hypothetical protein V757_03090 [Pelistega indica]
MNNTSFADEAIAYFTLAEKFLSLVQSSTHMIVTTKNSLWITTTHDACTPEGEQEFRETYQWTDTAISIPILFNFYHGIELLLKGYQQLLQIIIKNNFTHHISTLFTNIKEKLSDNHKIIQLLTPYIHDIPQNSIIDKFLQDNNSTIDKWYELLKYPTNKKKNHNLFSHFELKYGGNDALPFWKDIEYTAKELIHTAVNDYNSYTIKDSS